jgi:hypothetical protein
MSACVSFPWAENPKKEKNPPSPDSFQSAGPHEPKEGIRSAASGRTRGNVSK